MKAGTRKRYTGFLLASFLALFAVSGMTAETMLAVHGGYVNESDGIVTTIGAVSHADQSDAGLTILGVPYPDDDRGLTGVATNSEGRVFATVGSRAYAGGTGPRLIETHRA